MKFNQFDNEFWHSLDNLIQTSKIIIDRPKGSKHPKFPQIIYPLDYGYLENTSSMDGNGIDIWVGKADPKQADSILCTIDSLKRDSEIKILYGCLDSEKVTIYNFLNMKYMKALMISRF